jgi:plastocyanin
MISATLRNFCVRSFSIFAIAAVLSLHSGAVRADDTKVTIDNFTFTPTQLTIKVGTTVTWKNQDDIPHTIVSAGKFRSKALDTDDSYSFTFTAAGDYTYFCSLHPHMTGTIKVE